MGFRDFDSLRKNPDWPLLLARHDVRALLGDRQFPADPFGAGSEYELTNQAQDPFESGADSL